MPPESDDPLHAAGGPKTDFETLREDMKALRETLAMLVQHASVVGADEAKRKAREASEMAGAAAKNAGEYRELVEDKIRDHPLAAVGIALVAGMVFTSLNRRD